MSVEVLDSNMDPEVGDEMYDEEESVKSASQGLDARRKLEDKLEELRLQRELQDYDFDF